MIGWRGKIGMIVPSSNLVLESESNRLIPSGISVHFARSKIKRDTSEELETLAKNAPIEAKKLNDGGVDVIAFGCTTGSLLKGNDYDANIIKSIESETDAPAITTSSAVLSALREMNVKKISIATPYEQWLNNRVNEYFKENNIQVVSSKGLGKPDPIELSNLEPKHAYKLAREVDHDDADAVFISCTAFRTIEILEYLEKDLGKPVISSNQATIWSCLKILNISSETDGYGSLLSDY